MFPVDPLRSAIEAAFPTVRSFGVYNRRRIAGSTTWSQHAWGNAWDIRPPVDDEHQVVGAKTRNTLDDVHNWIQREKTRGTAFGGRKIGTVLWRVPAHWDHIHVETAPKYTGEPPSTPPGGTEMRTLDLQKALNEAGVTDQDDRPLIEDGVWGPRSQAALIKALTPGHTTPTDSLTVDTLRARLILETGAQEGLDPTFERDWEWAITQRLFTAHTNPDSVIRADRLAAFLHRYTTHVLPPVLQAYAPPDNDTPDGDVLRPGDLVRLDRAT